MKTRLDIRNEVLEILKRRGFDVTWTGGHYCCFIVKRNRQYRQWRMVHYEACNWIIKK